MTSSNQWLKAMLILSVVVSVAVTMKLAIPLMLNFAVNDLPAIWFMVISWLKPPYLYLLINGIIITIAASTRFNQNQNQNNNQSQHQLNNPPSTDLITSEPPTSPVVYDIKPMVMMEPPSVVYETIKRCDLDVSTTSTSHNGAIKSPPKFNYPTIKEKQILTSRFPHTKKPTTKGARALRVLKPKKHETMDSTWKMITDGSHKPLNKQFRKSDTFVNLQHSSPSNEFKKVVRKSETFKDRTNYENENQYLQPVVASGGKLNKDNSLSHDELNNRVEAFIKKFNDDMRLQRQQSLNQYKDMLKPGLH